MSGAEVVATVVAIVGGSATISGAMVYLGRKLSVLDSMTSQMKRLERSIDSLTGEIRTLDNKLDDHGNRLTRVETKLERSA